MVILPRLKRLVGPLVIGLRAHFLRWTAPLTSSLPLQTLADLGRSRSKLVAENALLRVPLIILKRQGLCLKSLTFRPFCGQEAFLPKKSVLYLISEEEGAPPTRRWIIRTLRRVYEKVVGKERKREYPQV